MTDVLFPSDGEKSSREGATKKIVAVYRAERFSPNSVDRDRAIMQSAAQAVGCSSFIKEEELPLHSTMLHDAGIILSMARGNDALQILTNAGRHALVVNSAAAIVLNTRSRIDSLMRANNIPAAPLHSRKGWWIKRGDQAAQEKSDVRFATDDNEKLRIVGEFKQRGISNLVVTAHVEGDLVKFYGVAGTGFFHICYPTDGNFSKFGDESINGKALHTAFNLNCLHNDASKLAKLTGIMVYGGDCIVRPDGSYAIIDFNDWPSFSCCRNEAAQAIAQLIKTMTKQNNIYGNI